MIRESFNLFFIQPIKELLIVFLSYLKFIHRFIVDTVFLTNIQKDENELLDDTFKLLKIIIFFIVSNIAYNEIFKNLDSNLWKELISEGSYIIFFYVSFLIFHYISKFYEKITSNTIHKVIVLRYLMIVLIGTVFYFQMDGIMNPNQENQNIYYDKAMADMSIVFLTFAALVFIQGIYLLRNRIIKWFDLLYYFILIALIFILIVVNGLIVLNINGIQLK